MSWNCLGNEINPVFDFGIILVSLCRNFGAIAQLGERLNGIQKVGGSTPPGSTISQIFLPDISIINLSNLTNNHHKIL